jgi:hypothetical protein
LTDLFRKMAKPKEDYSKDTSASSGIRGIIEITSWTEGIER